MKRMLGLWIVTMIGASGVSGQGVEPPEKPDILLIVIDDLGCRDLGVEGHPRHLTPVIDALATDSVRFGEAYCNGPNCSPSRAALFTGRHGSRNGVHTVGSASRGKPEDRRVDPPVNGKHIEESEITLAESLGAAVPDCRPSPDGRGERLIPRAPEHLPGGPGVRVAPALHQAEHDGPQS